MFNFSPESATDLIQQHREELFCFLINRVSCPETAADILQDAFIKLAHYKTATKINNSRAFLYRVVGNLAIDHLRKTQREQAYFTDASEELIEQADTTPCPERQLYSQQQLAHLQQAIAELSPRCQEIFILHKFKNYPYSQIMQELNIAEGTVLKHIIKAITHCRQRMLELEDRNESEL